MSEFAGFDLDRSTARAWGDFRSRLADHVAAMQDDEVVLVEAESSLDEVDSGSAPYVQFCAWGDDLVRCELASNAYLAAEHALHEEQVEMLVELGWAAPTHGPDEEADSGSTNFFVDAERNEADRLAVMTVRALRDVFGVAHPAFLSSDDLEPVDAPGPADRRETEGALAATPEDRDHLRAMVDAALVPVFGALPEHDSDDDVPVPNGGGLVWVRVLEDLPVVQLFSALVWDIGDLERAAFEVAVLNRDVPFLKFVLLEDTVMAYLYVPGLPFAPLHLRAMLDLMCRTVGRIDADLAVRVGGRTASESAGPDEDGDETDPSERPAMRTLLELDAEAPGSVDPELAAAICEQDRALVIELIGWTSEQGTRQGARLTHLLRGALRVMVERDAGRAPHRSGSGSDERHGTFPRRRRARDEVLPGLDSREPGLFDQ